MKRQALIIPPEKLAAEHEKLADEARVEYPVGEQWNIPGMPAPTSTPPDHFTIKLPNEIPPLTLDATTTEEFPLETLTARVYSPEPIQGLTRSRACSPSPHLLPPPKLSPKRLALRELAPPCPSLRPRRSTSESRLANPQRSTSARPRAELPTHLSTAIHSPERFVHNGKGAPSGVRQVDPSTVLSRAASPIPQLLGPERYSPEPRRIATEPHAGLLPRSLERAPTAVDTTVKRSPSRQARAT